MFPPHPSGALTREAKCPSLFPGGGLLFFCQGSLVFYFWDLGKTCRGALFYFYVLRKFIPLPHSWSDSLRLHIVVLLLPLFRPFCGVATALGRFLTRA